MEYKDIVFICILIFIISMLVSYTITSTTMVWFLQQEGEQVEEIGKAFGIKVVPIHLYGTIDDAVKYIKSRPKSMLSEDARFEGIVGRPLVELKDARGQRIIVKIKVVDFA